MNFHTLTARTHTHNNTHRSKHTQSNVQKCMCAWAPHTHTHTSYTHSEEIWRALLLACTLARSLAFQLSHVCSPLSRSVTIYTRCARLRARCFPTVTTACACFRIVDNPPAPESCKIFKGWPPPDVPSKLVQLWYKTFESDQRGLVEMKNPN